MEQTTTKRGRPKKTDIAKKKAGGRGVVGRPKGDAAIINEYMNTRLVCWLHLRVRRC